MLFVLLSLIVLALLANPEEAHLLSVLILRVIDLFCLVWFTIEYLLRFVASPDKLSFLRDPFNVIDLVATVAFYGMIVITYALSSVRWIIYIYFIFAGIHASRILKLLKLGRHSKVIRALGSALQRSVKDLGIMAVFLGVGLIFFSVLILLSEISAIGTQFTSMPVACWWAIVTISTVGYGDVYPITHIGRIIGAACCVFGIFFFMLQVPIAINSFERCYQEQKRHDRVIKRRIKN